MTFSSTSNLPRKAGLGFKPQHFDAILRQRQPVGFFEIHAENYMGAGGPPHARLSRLREDYALSIHGVGLSIGSMQPLDEAHLERLAMLCDRYQPESFSEHLAWSSHDGTYLNDLLPLPYTEETLGRVVEHVDRVQTRLGRQMLLENPATYLIFRDSTRSETDFLREVARRSGCGLLLDINNVFVSATNHNTDPADYLQTFPLEQVSEIHLGGHHCTADEEGAPLLIDSHDAAVIDPVWALYERVLRQTGPLPTLIEWDNNVPAWDVLLNEAETAQALMDACPRAAAA